MLNRIAGDEEREQWQHFCESGNIDDYLDFCQAKQCDGSGRIVGDGGMKAV